MTELLPPDDAGQQKTFMCPAVMLRQYGAATFSIHTLQRSRVESAQNVLAKNFRGGES